MFELHEHCRIYGRALAITANFNDLNSTEEWQYRRTKDPCYSWQKFNFCQHLLIGCLKVSGKILVQSTSWLLTINSTVNTKNHCIGVRSKSLDIFPFTQSIETGFGSMYAVCYLFGMSSLSFAAIFLCGLQRSPLIWFGLCVCVCRPWVWHYRCWNGDRYLLRYSNLICPLIFCVLYPIIMAMATNVEQQKKIQKRYRINVSNGFHP